MLAEDRVVLLGGPGLALDLNVAVQPRFGVLLKRKGLGARFVKSRSVAARQFRRDLHCRSVSGLLACLARANPLRLTSPVVVAVEPPRPVPLPHLDAHCFLSSRFPAVHCRDKPNFQPGAKRLGYALQGGEGW